MENLRGSGTIAGETSQAYKEIITISMVRPNIYSLYYQTCYSFLNTNIVAVIRFCDPLNSRLSLGHVPGYRNWCLSGTSRTKSHSSGKLPYHPDWSWGIKQGVEFHICSDTLNCTVSYLQYVGFVSFIIHNFVLV